MEGRNLQGLKAGEEDHSHQAIGWWRVSAICSEMSVPRVQGRHVDRAKALPAYLTSSDHDQSQLGSTVLRLLHGLRQRWNILVE